MPGHRVKPLESI